MAKFSKTTIYRREETLLGLSVDAMQLHQKLKLLGSASISAELSKFVVYVE